MSKYDNLTKNIQDISKNCPGFGIYPSAGLCFGLAHMYGRAVLWDDTCKYFDRLDILTRDYQTQPLFFKGEQYNSLAVFLNKVIIPFQQRKSRYAQNYRLFELTEEGTGRGHREYHIYSSIRAFLDGLLLYQNPASACDRGFLFENDRNTGRDPLNIQDPVSVSRYLGATEEGLYMVFGRPFVFDRATAILTFEKLWKLINDNLQNLRYYITVDSIDHTVTLTADNSLYDANLMNENGLYYYPFNGAKRLVSHFFDCTFRNYVRENTFLLLNISVYIDIYKDRQPEINKYLPFNVMYSEMFDNMLKSGLYKKTSLLYMACIYGHKDLVEKFLEYIDIDHIVSGDGSGYLPINGACASGNREIVKLLLDKGCWSSSYGCQFTPLHVACKWGHEDVVKELIWSRYSIIDVNFGDHENGDTPLHFACHNGNIRIVEYLLMFNNLVIDKVNNDGGTPLHLACQHGHTDIVALLLKRGANIDAIYTKKGLTSLSIACLYAVDEVILLLLHEGGNVSLDWLDKDLEKVYINNGGGSLRVCKGLRDWQDQQKSKFKTTRKLSKNKQSFYF